MLLDNDFIYHRLSVIQSLTTHSISCVSRDTAVYASHVWPTIMERMERVIERISLFGHIPVGQWHIEYHQ